MTMRYMKNDPYLTHPPPSPRGGGGGNLNEKKCNNKNNNNVVNNTYTSSSSFSSVPHTTPPYSSQNNRLFTYLRKSDWSSAYNRIQSTTPNNNKNNEAHHTNVDLNGNTALHLAFLSGSSSPPSNLIEAILEADYECASSIVTSKKDDKTKDNGRRGTTPLHLAVLHRSSPTTIALLLSANPSAANTVDEVGRTPLHRACSSIVIGGGTGDLNVLVSQEENGVGGGGGGLLPIESFTILVKATSIYFLLNHKDDRGYTALSYLSKRFEERAIWAVDHMRSTNACAIAAREDENEIEESDDYDSDDEYVHTQRTRRRRRRNRRSSRTYDDDAPSGYKSSCCRSLRSYGLGDFWDRVTAILLHAYYLQNEQNVCDTAISVDVQESVLHAALTLLSRSACPMTVAYLAVSVAHPNEARLMDAHGQLPIHLAAGAIIEDDDDDEDESHHSHHKIRWKRWKDDSLTKRRKQKTHKHVRDIISILIDLFPQGVKMRDSNGQLPFQCAEMSGRRWDDGLGLLLYEYPRCVVVHVEEGKAARNEDGENVGKGNDEFQDVCYPYILSLVGRGVIMPSSAFSLVVVENGKRCSSYGMRGTADDTAMVGPHRYCRRLGVMYEILRSQPHLMCFV